MLYIKKCNDIDIVMLYSRKFENFILNNLEDVIENMERRYTSVKLCSHTEPLLSHQHQVESLREE